MVLIKYFILLLSFAIMKSDSSKVMTVDKAETGSLNGNGQVTFYQLVIPPNIANSTYTLVLRIKENDEADEGKDYFSDPDIYVSKVIQLFRSY